MKSNAVGLETSLVESILCKSGTSSLGIFENASLVRYVKLFIYCKKATSQEELFSKNRHTSNMLIRK